MPLVINSLGGGHTDTDTDTHSHTNKHTHADVCTETFLTNHEYAPGLKTICLAIRIDVTMVCSSNELCAGLSSGIESHIHAQFFLCIITLILAGMCLWLRHQIHLTP